MLRRYQLLLQETLSKDIEWCICLLKCGSQLSVLGKVESF